MFAAAALFFAGCSDSGDDDSDFDGSFVISVPAGQTKYFSFAAGLNKEVTATNNQNWDIAFTQGRVILTNSGDTATDTGSGGQGGVWYTGQTEFGSVTSAAGADFSGTYAKDTKRYVNASASVSFPEGQGMPTTQNNLNVMTYIGYGFGTGDGDGSTYGTDGKAPFASYQYDADAFYKQGEQMGSYAMTRKVYIIRHGTGSGYTKIQITAMESPEGTSGPRVYAGYSQPLP
jgi:hypothetical protein